MNLRRQQLPCGQTRNLLVRHMKVIKLVFLKQLTRRLLFHLALASQSLNI